MTMVVTVAKSLLLQTVHPSPVSHLSVGGTLVQVRRNGIPVGKGSSSRRKRGSC